MKITNVSLVRMNCTMTTCDGCSAVVATTIIDVKVVCRFCEPITKANLCSGCKDSRNVHTMIGYNYAHTLDTCERCRSRLCTAHSQRCTNRTCHQTICMDCNKGCQHQCGSTNWSCRTHLQVIKCSKCSTTSSCTQKYSVELKRACLAELQMLCCQCATPGIPVSGRWVEQRVKYIPPWPNEDYGDTSMVSKWTYVEEDRHTAPHVYCAVCKSSYCPDDKSHGACHGCGQRSHKKQVYQATVCCDLCTSHSRLELCCACIYTHNTEMKSVLLGVKLPSAVARLCMSLTYPTDIRTTYACELCGRSACVKSRRPGNTTHCIECLPECVDSLLGALFS